MQNEYLLNEHQETLNGTTTPEQKLYLGIVYSIGLSVEWQGFLNKVIALWKCICLNA